MTPTDPFAQFTAKTLSKQSSKALKDERTEKAKLKKVSLPLEDPVVAAK
jgi:hypothetical protein